MTTLKKLEALDAKLNKILKKAGGRCINCGDEYSDVPEGWDIGVCADCLAENQTDAEAEQMAKQMEAEVASKRMPDEVYSFISKQEDEARKRYEKTNDPMWFYAALVLSEAYENLERIAEEGEEHERERPKRGRPRGSKGR